MENNDIKNRFFATEHLSADLGKRSLRGGFFAMSGQVLYFVLTFSGNVILARLLTPADFGLLAMIMPVIGLMNLFSDAGLSIATIQRENINHYQVSNLFWINFGLGIGLAIFTLGLAPCLSFFYGESRLFALTMLMSVNFLINSLGVQHQALLQRQMRLGTLVCVQNISFALGIAAGVSTALLGWNYWALATMYITHHFSRAFLYLVFCGWRPGLPRKGTGVRSLLTFGGNLTGARFCQYISANIDKVLLGAMCGPSPLGLYYKAQQLLLLPMRQINTPLNQVALPALSRLSAQPERFRRYYMRGLTAVSMITLPIGAFFFLEAEKIILFLLGPQWTGSIELLRYLAPAAVVVAVSVSVGWMFSPLGRTGREFRAAFLGSSFTTAGYLAGVHWGAKGLAIAFSLVSLLKIIPLLQYAYRGTSLSMADFFSSIGRSILACFAALFFAYLSMDWIPACNLFFSLLMSGALFGFVYISAWIALPGGIVFFKEITSLAWGNFDLSSK